MYTCASLHKILMSMKCNVTVRNISFHRKIIIPYVFLVWKTSCQELHSICIHVYVPVYLHTHTNIDSCSSAQIHHPCICTYMSPYNHPYYAQIHVSVKIYAYIFTHSCVPTCIHAHKYIYECMYAYIHIHACVDFSFCWFTYNSVDFSLEENIYRLFWQAFIHCCELHQIWE